MDKAEKKAAKEREKAEKKAAKEREKADKKAKKEGKKAKKSPKPSRVSAHTTPQPDPTPSTVAATPSEPPAAAVAPSPTPKAAPPADSTASADPVPTATTAPDPPSSSPSASSSSSSSGSSSSSAAAAAPKATPPAVTVTVAETDANGSKESGVVVRSEKTTTLRPRSGRVSMSAAPAQLPEGTSILSAPQPEEQAPKSEAEMLQEKIVEEQQDEEVGIMLGTDHSCNAEYLASTLAALRDRMTDLSANGTNRGYSMGYQAMAPVGYGQPATCSAKEENKLKNRYGNICAFDHSRVVLDTVDGDPHSDYINANWVDGYKKQNAFIASQGPVPNSFISFWRMIWQYKIEVICMVTHEVEGGRMKCHRYWPDPSSNPPSKKQQYGSVVVSHESSEPHKHFVLRTFTVEHLQHSGVKMSVKQFAYTSWPDHGVPLTTHELLGFRNAVNHAVTDPDVPMLVHCSAGVGRTGTYIAIDTLVRQALDRGGPLEIDSIIKSMRMRRNFMVQTEIQYIFIHRAVLDALTELFEFETKKAEMLASGATEEALQSLQSQAEEAARRKLEEDETEREAIAEAQREIEKQVANESLARSETSAESAAKVVSHSIADRLKMLKSAQQAWLENYKQSLEEWSARNQFEAEQYDLTSSLTPVQSRLEALRQKGLG